MGRRQKQTKEEEQCFLMSVAQDTPISTKSPKVGRRDRACRGREMLGTHVAASLAALFDECVTPPEPGHSASFATLAETARRRALEVEALREEQKLPPKKKISATSCACEEGAQALAAKLSGLHENLAHAILRAPAPVANVAAAAAEAAHLDTVSRVIDLDASIEREVRGGRLHEAVAAFSTMSNLLVHLTGAPGVGHGRVYSQGSRRENLSSRMAVALTAHAQTLCSRLRPRLCSTMPSLGWPRCDGSPFEPRDGSSHADFFRLCSDLVAVQSADLALRARAGRAAGASGQALQPCSLWLVDTLLAPVRPCGSSPQASCLPSAVASLACLLSCHVFIIGCRAIRLQFSWRQGHQPELPTEMVSHMAPGLRPFVQSISDASNAARDGFTRAWPLFGIRVFPPWACRSCA